MAKRKRTSESTDREKWNKVFNALAHMLQTQQTQLQSLAKERKLLEDRIKLQHERWVSDVNLFKDHISEMKRDFTAQEMERMVEAAKSDLLMGLKQREAFMYKHKLENSDSELADFREWFDYLSRKLAEHEDTSQIANKGDEHRVKVLESELRRLKSENEKLKSEKKSEVSALLAEKKFVWNQYDKMESNLKEQLQKKSAEVELANKKIQALLSNMEVLQSSNSEKDNAVERLRSDLAKLESDLIKKKNEEISRISRELELLKMSRSASTTPTLRRCTLGRGKNSATDEKVVTVKKESDTSQHHGKGSRSSKRKAVEVITISETPKLFTSSFKVPKLKSASPCVVCDILH